MKYASSLAQIRKHIQKRYPLVGITRGNGYYYFFSDDMETHKKLDQSKTTSVYVFNCRQMTLDQWMQALETTLNGQNNGGV